MHWIFVQNIVAYFLVQDISQYHTLVYMNNTYRNGRGSTKNVYKKCCRDIILDIFVEKRQ